MWRKQAKSAAADVQPGKRRWSRCLRFGLLYPGMSLLVLGVGLNGCWSTPRYVGPVSDHFDGAKFFNPGVNTDKSLAELWRWKLSGQRRPWPARIENAGHAAPSKPGAGQAVVTFIGHATFLIQTPDGNLLTDPIWSQRASPVQFAGPRRVRDAALPIEDLPRIDVVLISHDHYDHLDAPTIRQLAQRDAPLFVAGLGNGPTLRAAGATRVAEMDWWQTLETPRPGLAISMTPAQHWSGRSLNDRRNTLWGGYVISSSGPRVYFAGDSGYSAVFGQIAERFGPLDLCLLPIGAYEPRWFMRLSHMNPDDAVRAHVDLRSPLSIGMHYGTFALTDEGPDDPIRDLATACAAHGVVPSRFRTLDFGESLVVDRSRPTADAINAAAPALRSDAAGAALLAPAGGAPP